MQTEPAETIASITIDRSGTLLNVRAAEESNRFYSYSWTAVNLVGAGEVHKLRATRQQIQCVPIKRMECIRLHNIHI